MLVRRSLHVASILQNVEGGPVKPYCHFLYSVFLCIDVSRTELLSCLFRNLQLMKQKRKGASQGHQLLKRKSDALSARFRGMLKEIVKVRDVDTKLAAFR